MNQVDKLTIHNTTLTEDTNCVKYIKDKTSPQKFHSDQQVQRRQIKDYSE